MSVLSREDRSVEAGPVSDGPGPYLRTDVAPRCLSGLEGILAAAALRSTGLHSGGFTSTTPVPTSRSLLKLWEIDRSWHCGILGICLDPAELRSVATKSDAIKAKARSAGDFELHVAALRFACRDRDLGKALTKALDRKHARILALVAKIDDAETLRTRWDELASQGEAAGAYWALMSHPETTDDLRVIIAGDVHLRLYRGLGAGRAETRRVQALEKELATTEAKSARRLAQARDELAGKEGEIAELRRRLARQQAEGPGADAAEAARWRDQAAELRRLVEASDEAARLAQSELRELRARVERLAASNEKLAAENAALSRREEPRDDQPWGDDAPGAEGADLEGRTFLFVGGRTQHIPHYRRLVEDRNGVFLHHDGGVDDSIARLRGLFGRADAVLFPVDCVSHMAQDELKRLCRRWDKPFIPVRRSGFGAFQVALETAAAIA